MRVAGIGRGLEGLVEDNGRAGLALAHPRAKFVPLLQRGPAGGRVAALPRRDPEHDGVDAVIAAPRGGIDGQAQALAARPPGHGPVAWMGLDRGDQAIGDGGVDVLRLRGGAWEF